MEKIIKLIYEEGFCQVFTITGHPNGACYLLKRKNNKEIYNGVIGEYCYSENEYKKRIKELNSALSS